MKEIPNPTFDLSPIQLPRGSLHPGVTENQIDGLPRRVQSTMPVSWAKHQDEVR